MNAPESRPAWFVLNIHSYCFWTLEIRLAIPSDFKISGDASADTFADQFPQVCMDAPKLLMKTPLQRGQRGTSASAGSGWGGRADGVPT